jgi:hypothetical protein
MRKREPLRTRDKDARPDNTANLAFQAALARSS